MGVPDINPSRRMKSLSESSSRPNHEDPDHSCHSNHDSFDHSILIGLITVTLANMTTLDHNYPHSTLLTWPLEILISLTFCC